MKKQMVLGGFLCLLLLVGAGCNSEESKETKPQTKSANAPQTEVKDTTTEVPVTEKTKEVKKGDFTLSAEAAGKSRVHFTWSAPEGVDAKDGFRIVRGPSENPSFPGNFWYHPKNATTEANWIKLPKGKQHFRVCAFENNTCTAYSNNVEVTVK